MNQNRKILITGSSGMVGKSLVKKLTNAGFTKLFTPSSKELDLRIQGTVHQYFKQINPEYVFHLAGRIGGIGASIAFPVEFMYENLIMALNVINASKDYGVRKLLFVGSSCIYPLDCPQPMNENSLLDGKFEPTNEGYAIAKIAGIKLCEYYNYQYNTNFMSLVPCNLYGYNDHFEIKNSHVISSLIYKFFQAKLNLLDSVEVWGTGTTRREFLFVEDFVDAMIFFISNFDAKSINNFVNIGSGADLTISELAILIKNIVGYQGEIKFNSEKADGMPKKLLDVSKSNRLGWCAKVTLTKGLNMTYNWFFKEHNLLETTNEK